MKLTPLSGQLYSMRRWAELIVTSTPLVTDQELYSIIDNNLMRPIQIEERLLFYTILVRLRDKWETDYEA